MRVKELLSAVSDRFLQHIKENPGFWLSNGSIAMVLLGILKTGNGNLIYFIFIIIFIEYLYRGRNLIYFIGNNFLGFR